MIEAHGLYDLVFACHNIDFVLSLSPATTIIGDFGIHSEEATSGKSEGMHAH